MTGGGTGGSGFAGTAYIADGTLGIVTVTTSGGGFTTTPTITFPAPDSIAKTGIGTTATAVAVINTAGAVTDVWYTNTGVGYTAGDLPVYATFSLPSMDSVGNYIFNEVVTGSTSGVTARVRTWNAVTNILEVNRVSGTFVLGEKLVGGTSGASRALRLADVQPPDDGFADNTNIEIAADEILDFSEINPFGIP